MAIGRISGSVLKSNLTRNGVDLAFETNLLYLDVTNSRVGIGTSEPTTTLQVNGTTTTAGLTANGAVNIDGTGTSNMDNVIIGANTAAAITGTTITGTLAGATGSTIGNLTLANGSITDSSGAISFGNENLTTTGTLTVSGLSYPSTDGTNGQVLQTDGAGNLTFVDLSIGDLVITGSTIYAPSNADLRLSTQGSGTVVINNLSFPIGDGSANQVLATNGAGQLTFVDSGAASTDSTEAGTGDETTDLGLGSTVINSFNVATYDSAFYFLVTRDEVNQDLDLRRHSLTHDDSVAVVNTFGQVRSDVSGSYITVDADVNSNLARLTATGQSVSNSVSLYRIVLGQDTTASSSGNTAFVVNTDVDSTVENLDTWSASTYRGAQYFISATNSTTGESSNMEALVVTDGTDAFITPYGNVNTGNNDLIELSADVDTGSVRLRAFARTPNTRVAMYRILLGDSESSSSGTSVNIIGATSVSSASTTLDSFSSDDYHGAMYLVVAHNSTEGESSVQTVYMLNDGADAYHTTGPSVNSKGTNQLEFTSSFSGGTATLSCSSTSGSDTTVNAYRIHLKRGAANTVTTNTNQIITGEKTFTSALLIDTIRSPGSNADIKLEPQGTGDVVLNSLRSDDSSAVVIKDNLKVTGLTTDNAFLINAGDGTIGESNTIVTNSGQITLNTAVALSVVSDPTTVANKAHIYAKDVTSSAEVFVRDEVGNVTQISPHNREGDWVYYSENINTGKRVRVNMEKMIRRLEEITGETFFEEYYDPTKQ